MSQDTSIHLRRARDGDDESTAWLVRRLNPLLIAQARQRLGTRLTAVIDPEDLVADVWVVALPKLRQLTERQDRITPVLIRYLSTTLVQMANNIARKMVRRRAKGDAERDDIHDIERRAVALDTHGVITRVAIRESNSHALDALRGLPELDQQIVLMRGVEQVPGAEVAEQLGLSTNAVSLRYRRSLERLRSAMPDSVFEELPDESP